MWNQKEKKTTKYVCVLYIFYYLLYYSLYYLFICITSMHEKSRKCL